MTKLITLLTAMLVSFAVVSTVEARPKNKRNHYQNVVTINGDENNSAVFFANDRARAGFVENPIRTGMRKSFTTMESAVFSGGNLVAKASRYIGANARQLGLPSRLWCADFMNMLTGTGTDRRAISYARRGSPAPHGCTNCVAVTKRRGGGHVGIVSGYDNRGNPILISGNHGRKVGVGVYAKQRVVAYRYI
jgi:uncharacterized protein (TIGR02594 family)